MLLLDSRVVEWSWKCCPYNYDQAVGL